jgi:hypothetical protein
MPLARRSPDFGDCDIWFAESVYPVGRRSLAFGKPALGGMPREDIFGRREEEGTRREGEGTSSEGEGTRLTAELPWLGVPLGGSEREGMEPEGRGT